MYPNRSARHSATTRRNQVCKRVAPWIHIHGSEWCLVPISNGKIVSNRSRQHGRGCHGGYLVRFFDPQTGRRTMSPRAIFDATTDLHITTAVLPARDVEVSQTCQIQRWVRPYLVESTTSRPICEVKQLQAQLVLRSVMTREPWVSYSPTFFLAALS